MRTWPVACSVLLLANACGGSTSADVVSPPKPGPASSATLVGGSLDGPVATDRNVTATIKDATGTAVPNQLVSFVVTSGGGKVFAGSAISTASGEVHEVWTLGTKAGLQTLEVRTVDQSNGAPRVLGSFAASASPDVPVRIAGANTSYFLSIGGYVTGAALLADLGVGAIDRYGNVVSGAVSVAITSLLSMSGDTIRGPLPGRAILSLFTKNNVSAISTVDVVRDMRPNRWAVAFKCANSPAFDSLTYLSVSDSIAYGTALPGKSQPSSMTVFRGTVAVWDKYAPTTITASLDTVGFSQWADTTGYSRLGVGSTHGLRGGNYLFVRAAADANRFTAVAGNSSIWNPPTPCDNTWASRGVVTLTALP